MYEDLAFARGRRGVAPDRQVLGVLWDYVGERSGERGELLEGFWAYVDRREGYARGSLRRSARAGRAAPRPQRLRRRAGSVVWGF